MLLDGKPRSFKSGATLYDPDEEKDMDVGNVEVQIKQDPMTTTTVYISEARESSNGSKKSGNP